MGIPGEHFGRVAHNADEEARKQHPNNPEKQKRLKYRLLGFKTRDELNQEIDAICKPTWYEKIAAVLWK